MTSKTVFAGLLLSALAVSSSQAQEKFVKTFNPGSYQQILRENAAKPFILAVWSVDCPSCLKDMGVLNQIRQNHPDLKIVMLSTDDPSATSEVKNILARNRLGDLDNWIFGSDDAQKLRYEIDPGWYGELPRTYFFSSTHNRVGKSGALKIEEFETQISKIKP
ncbi:hypothetical protein IVG45_04445 [Methylomonas sp. LL1]|uniref:TlpA family protein disulfide reductase n=1 Tax=Methylomonas sp. LL1 TaxID=2785785 RepID=UPI0018C42EF2|nr:hypothetical protein [Methylomonas sp. LL1]QPK64225.1 hypothetical protein IVG45_04445 [Methylomonas sp. LL1]